MRGRIVVGRELLAAEEQVRLLGRQVDGEAQGVEDSHLVATVECGGAQTLRRVGAQGAGSRSFMRGCKMVGCPGPTIQPRAVRRGDVVSSGGESGCGCPGRVASLD